VETFRRVLVGSENNAEDVATFWRALDPLVAQGTTVIISHHYRKPGRNSKPEKRDMASGSTDILAGADCAYSVELARQQDRAVLECVKMRDTAEPEPFQVAAAWNDPDGPVLLTHEQYTPVTQGEARATQLFAVVKTYFASQPNREARAAELLGLLIAAGAAESTAEKRLRHFVKCGHLEKLRKGFYRLPAATIGI
jgi:hypothetical protein